jgi:ribosome-associated toxin RatA of RatAB toxin-antitoxin module
MVESRRDPHPGRALALSALLLIPIAAQSSEEVSVEATRVGDALEIVCRASLVAPIEVVWQTLTDYDRLHEFVPGMRRSRTVERRGAVAVIEQSGEARFLVFTFPIDVTLSSTERPPHSIEATMVKGNLKRLQGTYRIEPQGGGRVTVTWTGVIEALSMPPLFGETLMRASIEDQFRGMVQEIARRAAARREAGASK